MSNWEHRKERALRLLHRLLGVWRSQPEDLFDNITTIGLEANREVDGLQLPTDLPLPYDDEKMSGLRGIFAHPEPRSGEEDGVSKNIVAWINLLGEAVPEQDLLADAVHSMA